MDIYNSISLVIITYLNLAYGDLCDPNKGPEGTYDCVHIPKYDDYQWAVCLSSQTLRKHTFGFLNCKRSAYCWLPCTKSVYPKSVIGHVMQECKCDPIENERRKRSLHGNIQEMKVTVPNECYIPAFTNNCEWYSNCLEAHSSCEQTDFHYAVSYGKAICSIFLETFDSFSEDGKYWITSSQKCISDKLKSILMPNDTSDCKNVRELAYIAHTKCYLNHSKPQFCNLQHTDQMKIYWSIKQVYQNSFSEHFDDAMAEFRSCLHNDVYGEQTEYIFYVKKDIDTSPKAIEKDFASSLANQFAFSSHGLDWDVDLQMSNRMRTKREIDFYSEKKYQPVGIFVSQQRVKLVERSSRALVKHRLRKTDESEYDETFLASFDESITNALKDNTLEVVGNAMSKRKWLGFIRKSGAIFRVCFGRSFFPWLCIISVLKLTLFSKVLPDTPEEINPTFTLYTKNNIDNGISLLFSDLSTLAHFNPSKSTFIIIHGYRSNGDSDWVKHMTSSLLDKTDANVIVVDWKNGADYLARYNQAVANTEVVGKILALMVGTLEKHRGATETYIHVIGHSLGAHIAGFAGKSHKLTRYQRITGLDPAGPFFNKEKAKGRLSASDAHLVDVIHTNGGAFGYLNPLGHLDFYPNGGVLQPECDFLSTCSHSRVHLLFTASIISDRIFGAKQCESLRQCTTGKGLDLEEEEDNKMGFYTDVTKKRRVNTMYYLQTNITDLNDVP
uniref:Lipase domain-containing protein n=1 Tax=Magallana gigas TaxID=29159 RepID=A0A8W8L5B8_MAGGI|nr:uncharacterized protein LOC105322194 isoform X1 [Crassostrea gigas]